MANGKKKNEVAKTGKAGLPAERYDYGTDKGAGWEGTKGDSSHFQIPFLNQLQALSPEVSGSKDEKIAGAEPGMFINSVSKQLRGEVILVPCTTKHSVVEWVPREKGGGFVAEHGPRSEVVEDAKRNAAGDMTKLATEKGNDLIDTFSIYALVLNSVDDEEPADQVVISFTKTKAKRYREIMTRLHTCKEAREAPMFAHRLRMTVTDERNKAGQPYKNIKIEPAVENNVLQSMIAPGHPLLEYGRALQQSVETGAARANYESTSQESSSSRDEVF